MCCIICGAVSHLSIQSSTHWLQQPRIICWHNASWLKQSSAEITFIYLLDVPTTNRGEQYKCDISWTEGQLEFINICLTIPDVAPLPCCFPSCLPMHSSKRASSIYPQPIIWVLIKKWSAVAWTTWGQLLPWTLVSMEVHHIWKPRVKHHWPVSHTTVLTAVHAVPIVRSFPFHSHMAMVFKLMGKKRKRKKHPLRCFIEEKKHLILCVVKVSLQTVLYAVTMQKACYRRTQRKEEETVCDL